MRRPVRRPTPVPAAMEAEQELHRQAVFTPVVWAVHNFRGVACRPMNARHLSAPCMLGLVGRARACSNW